MSSFIYKNYKGDNILEIRDGNYNEKLMADELCKYAGGRIKIVFTGSYTLKRAIDTKNQISKICKKYKITLEE